MRSRENPFEMIERTFDEMSRRFEEVARTLRTEGRGGSEGGFGGTADGGRSGMGIDLADHDDSFVVTADVPGFDVDDIDLQIQGDALLISATREHAGEEREGTYLRSEREHHSLTERVRLPGPVAEDEAEATLRNGVLTVTLPKVEPAESGNHRIDIE